MGTLQTFQVYDDEFQSSLTEVLMQNADAFNSASAGTINIVPDLSRGRFAREAFFQSIDNLIRHRDPSSQTQDDDDDLTQDEFVQPKVNKKYQVRKTVDAFRKILPAQNPESVFSSLLGEQVGKAVMVDYLNTGLASLYGAVSGNADVIHDASGDTEPNLDYATLVEGLAQFGDASNDIVAWVMHSKPFHDLLGESVGIATDRVAGRLIYEGVAGTLGRPVVVTDSQFLVNEGGTDPSTYNTFGLQSNALNVIESEGGVRTPVTDMITGLENLALRIQGEHAFNLRVRGYSYDDTAGANPTNSVLNTTANWTMASTSKKSTAGVMIITE